jgi:hypothetical protein
MMHAQKNIKSKDRLVYSHYIFIMLMLNKRPLRFSYIFLYKIFVLPCLRMA